MRYATALKALAVALLITWGGGALLFFVVARRVVEDPSQIPLSYILFCTVMTAIQAKYIYDFHRGKSQ